MSNLSWRFAWSEFDTGTFLNHHPSQRSGEQIRTDENTSLWGLNHMTVGTGALRDAQLFFAVNRSHVAIGA